MKTTLNENHEFFDSVGLHIENYAAIQGDIDGYAQASKALVIASFSSTADAALQRPLVTKSFEKLEQSLGNMGMQIEHKTHSLVSDDLKNTERTVTLISTLAVLFVIGAFGLAWRNANWLQKLMGGEPDELNQIMSRFGSGDLAIKRSGAVGSIRASIGDAASMLTHTMVELHRQAIDVLAPTAHHLAQSSSESEQAAWDQVRDIESIATAATEMTATGIDISRSTQLAATAAQNATATTSAGRKTVARLIQVSSEMATTIQKAEGVIRQLESDASEIGRGFAVVADEVRSLAQRAGQSTQEIQSIIETLRKRTSEAVTVTQSGLKLALTANSQSAEAETSLRESAAAASIIEERNIQIAAASEEMSTVMEDIQRNLVHITDRAKSVAETAVKVRISGTELDQSANNISGSLKNFRF